MAEQDLETCGDCGRCFPIAQLDPVLLDPQGAAASDALYCRECFPRHRVVPGDCWASLDGSG